MTDWEKILPEGWYRLENRKPVPITKWEEMGWKERAPESEWRVGQDKIGDWSVSTVFLGLDHSMHFYRGKTPPVLFETMIFDDLKSEPGEGRDGDLWCERYCTWEEAEAGHARAVEMIKAFGRPTDSNDVN